MKTSRVIALLTVCTFVLSGCARNMSSDYYTSDSTLSLTLEGTIKHVRPITIADAEKLGENTLGGLAGGALGAAGGSGIGNGSGQALAVVGAVIVGSVVGALVEAELGKQDGFEYILKVDPNKIKDSYYYGTPAMRKAISAATTDGLITVIQGNDVVLSKGEDVYVIISDKRTRVISQD